MDGSAEAAWLATLPTLRDDRIVIRPLSLDDVAAWNAGDDEEQRRWFEAPGPSTEAGVRSAIDRWQASWRVGGPVFHFGIRTVAGGELAGGVELRVREDGRANVSYVVFPAFRRQGFARRAVVLAAEYAGTSLNVTALVAIIDRENTASIAVAHAAGFAFDGRAEAWEYSESGVMHRYLLPIADGRREAGPGGERTDQAGSEPAGGA